MTLGILLLENLKMEICTYYMEVGMIVKLTISQLKLGNSEFGSLVSRKTAFNLPSNNLDQCFFILCHVKIHKCILAYWDICPQTHLRRRNERRDKKESLSVN